MVELSVLTTARSCLPPIPPLISSSHLSLRGIRWPAIIYHPSVIPETFKPLAFPFLGKKHCIYCYATGDWGLASPGELTNFAAHLPVREFQQEAAAEDRAVYVEAVRLGREDMWESRQDRVAWNHRGDGGRKTRLLKVAKTLLKHRWGEAEVREGG